jgi:hypothetical protein
MRAIGQGIPILEQFATKEQVRCRGPELGLERPAVVRAALSLAKAGILLGYLAARKERK